MIRKIIQAGARKPFAQSLSVTGVNILIALVCLFGHDNLLKKEMRTLEHARIPKLFD